MDSHEAAGVVEELITLVGEHYLDHEVAAKISETLATSLAAGRYRSDDVSLADAVTTDLQSVNGDKHLRLIYHAEVLPEREHGEDAAEYDAIARWADQTCFGIARVERLPGNVGYLDLQPVLFPAAIAGDAITAAMSLIAPTEALIIDLRACRGGDPATAAWLCSYLFRREPVQLTGLHEPRHGRTTQSWTLPFVPGRRFAATKPVYVLTSSATFSGGEQVSYDLQQLGRATIVDERTKGGAHAREGFRLHPHLEATIPVARGVNPVSGGNWEGTGVTPDVTVPAQRAHDRAYRLALEHVTSLPDPIATEARLALTALNAATPHC
ncbi:MAG TPA: S41 family peptidase, partial [Streptosporangiaceae bacterium]|nr:S41 family peptidase [Streptosporangiaceae bacterium]